MHFTAMEPRPENGNLALFKAVEKSTRPQEVEDLLKAEEVDIHSVDDKGRSLLHLSSALKHGSKAVALLLEKGANIDLQDFNGKTPLHYACTEGNDESVMILLAKGANMDIVSYRSTDDHGGTPLHLAIDNNRPKTVEILLKAGAGVGIKNKTKSAPLHNAARLGYCEIADKLIEVGANVNDWNNLGRTPLHVASASGHCRFVSKLIENGANLARLSGGCLIEFNEHGSKRYDFTDESVSRSAIHFAVEFDHVNIVEVLIKAGADVDELDGDGATALHYAASGNNCKMINVLIRFGAEINFTDEHNETPLHHAVKANHRQAVKILCRLGAEIQGAKYNPLYIAASKNLCDIANILLHLGADIDCEIGLFRGLTTPLQFAAMKGNIEFVDLLLKKGANVKTTLHVAAQKNHLNIVKLLIKAGADIFASDEEGDTVLHVTANSSSQDLSLLSYLMEFFQSDIDLKSSTGKTALHNAAIVGNTKYVTFLINAGADINIMSDDMLTALDYARDVNVSCAQTLVNYVLILRSLNMISCRKLLNDIDVINDLTNYSAVINNELAKLKVTPIGNSNITFYNFLCKSVSQLAVCLNNDNIREVLSCLDLYELDFPQYKFLIVNHFKKGLQRKLVVDSAILKWYEHFPILPYDCICQILSYFNGEELSNFEMAKY